MMPGKLPCYNNLMELEPSTNFQPDIDRRQRVPEPLPVKLVAVEDVTLPAMAGLEKEMDHFYAGLWGFEREQKESGLVYRAENFRLRFEAVEGLISRDTYRPAGIEVHSLAEAEKKLIDAELEYTRQRGLTPGTISLLLLDPAGNWVELMEAKPVR